MARPFLTFLAIGAALFAFESLLAPAEEGETPDFQLRYHVILRDRTDSQLVFVGGGYHRSPDSYTAPGRPTLPTASTGSGLGVALDPGRGPGTPASA